MDAVPLNNYILVESLGEQKRTPGGLYLPDKVDQEPRWYRVLKPGPGLPDMFGNIQHLDYREGEYVYVFPHAIHKVNLRDYGERYPERDVLFLSEGDVLVRSNSPGELRFQPVGSYCVIRRIKLPEARTAGGIYLPDQSVPPPALAKVVAVGNGYRTAATGIYSLLNELFGQCVDPVRLRSVVREHVPLHVQPGDTVLVVATAPMKLRLEQFGLKQDDLYVVGELDILCVLRSEEAS